MKPVLVQQLRAVPGRLAVALAAVAVLVAVHAPGAQAAPDPVIRTVNVATAQGRLSPAMRAEYLRVWRKSARVARHLDRTGARTRAREIQGVRGVAVTLARRGGLSVDRMPAVFANVRATTWVFEHRGPPKPRSRVTVPFDPVVFGYYPGYGLQVQPLFTFSRANTLHLTFQNRELADLMFRMEELSVRRNGYLTWEYYFPFGGGYPWVSAMAQAVGVDAFGRAYDRTGNRGYLRIAQQAMRGLERPVSRGGMAVPLAGGGRWYPLYQFNPSQRVLNGHLQVVLSLNNYLGRVPTDARARRVLVYGLKGVRPQLHRFDTGAWSNYQPGQEADVGYHDLMTYQLSRLGRQLNDDVLAAYAHRFARYRSTPPLVVVPRQRIIPAYTWPRDGFHDTSSLRYTIDKTADMTFEVRTRTGQVVARWTDSVRPGRHFAAWNGLTSEGKPAPVGIYTLRISAVDRVGNRRTGEVTAALRVARDTADPTLTGIRLQGRGGSSRLRLRAVDSESPWLRVTVTGPAGRRLVDRQVRPGTIRLALPAPAAQLAGGQVIVSDSSGNRASAIFR